MNNNYKIVKLFNNIYINTAFIVFADISDNFTYNKDCKSLAYNLENWPIEYIPVINISYQKERVTIFALSDSFKTFEDAENELIKVMESFNV